MSYATGRIRLVGGGVAMLCVLRPTDRGTGGRAAETFHRLGSLVVLLVHGAAFLDLALQHLLREPAPPRMNAQIHPTPARRKHVSYRAGERTSNDVMPFSFRAFIFVEPVHQFNSI